MKKLFYSAILFLIFTSTFSQVFWNESFGSGCNVGQYANGFNPGLGVWTVSLTGTNDPYANKWFISSMEGGQIIGACGADECSGSLNRTLHVGVDIPLIPVLDLGASYSAGNGYSDSDMRIQSPTISCTCRNNISLTFKYLLEGVAGTDYFDVQYSANGGATWSVIATPAQTNNGPCLPQGTWTGYTISLPASANNNPNVKIGFRWENTDPSGADPSVAIDDVALTSASITPFASTFTLANPLCAANITTVAAATTCTYVVSGYTWTASPAGPVIASPNASVTNITFPAAGTFSIILAANSGGTLVSNTQTVLVNPAPTITANATPTLICPGGSSTLTVTGANSYTWNPGALVGGTITVTPTVTSIYTVTGASIAGCTNSVVKTVSLSTVPAITVAASPATICPGQSAILTGSGFNTYTWTPGPLNGFSVSVSPTVTTIYTLNATTGAGCASGSKTLSVIITTCTGISSTEKNNTTYLIFPNPTSDKLFIQVNNNGAVEASIEIVDALGKTIFKQNNIFSATENTRTINVAMLNSGIYLVKITSLTESKVIRFIKE